ncbi:MAG TPA: nucleotidyltransferase family protein [Gemmatimonadaceae bacterium]
MIAGLLLAAGYGRRFGGNKLCAKLNGKAIVRSSADVLAPTDALYVVVPPAADQLTQALARLDATFVVNLARGEGMASSIRAGIAALAEDVEAVVIALGDQPRADAAVTRALCERWRAGECDAVVPLYLEGQGTPVLFGRTCFSALSALRGDVGARGVLESGQFTVEHVHTGQHMPVDVDTVETLDALREHTHD